MSGEDERSERQSWHQAWLHHEREVDEAMGIALADVLLIVNLRSSDKLAHEEVL